MAVFEYKVLDTRGQAQAGTLTADSPADGRRRLRENGWRIERFAPALRPTAIAGSVWRKWLRIGRSAQRADQVAEFARHLALLLRSGVPLSEALAVLITQQRRGPFQTVLRELRARVMAGSALAEAMTVHPDWFDAVFLSAVRVGQQAGTLEIGLSELARFLKERHTLWQKVVAALVYPLILMVLGAGVTLFLMTYVIPQLLTILTANGQPLPLATAILKSLSDALVNHWLWLLLSMAIVVGGAAAAWRSTAGRRMGQCAILRLPLIGALVRKTLVARFAQQMTMLLRSGIPFTEAVAIVGQGSSNLVLADELTAVEQAVAAGSDIAPALAHSRVFPPLVVHLVAVGQDAGELPEMLSELKDGYETEVNLALGKFTAALEPLLIVLLAGIIGLVIFATVLPILQATDVMR